MYSKLLPTKEVDLPGRVKRDGLFFIYTEHFGSGYIQDCKVSPIVPGADLCRRRTGRAENNFSIKESRIH